VVKFIRLRGEVVFFSVARWRKSLISLRKFCSFCQKNEGFVWQFWIAYVCNRTFRHR